MKGGITVGIQLTRMENCFGRLTQLLTIDLKNIERTDQQLYIFHLGMTGQKARRT